jgi:cytoskeletal protein CcmA (bactofilin family)
MINKLLPKKPDNRSVTDVELLEQIDALKKATNEGPSTVLESNPDFHVSRLNGMMNSGPSSPRPGISNAEKRTVLIGPGVAFDGSIGNCDEVIIEGTVKATITATHLLVKETGVFTGSAEVAKAEIDGEYEGSLIASSMLQKHQTGRVTGDINYAQLEIASGGILTDTISVSSDKDASHENGGG